MSLKRYDSTGFLHEYGVWVRGVDADAEIERLERVVAELREAAKRVLNAHLRDPDYFLDYEVVAARIEYNESRAALERLIYAPPAQGGSERG